MTFLNMRGINIVIIFESDFFWSQNLIDTVHLKINVYYICNKIVIFKFNSKPDNDSICGGKGTRHSSQSCYRQGEKNWRGIRR